MALAEAICERFELEQVRIVNSGTEATMDALRVARAATGRDKVIKMEGSYHGHHDSLLFSVVPEADVLGLRHDVDHEGKAWYTTQPTSKGIPRALWDTTIVVPFNDAGAVEQALSDNEGDVAAVILEPVMMNVGIIEPQPGYLQALRDTCERHGAVLIYDEVKCGGTMAYGGTMERYGVKPHLSAFAKAIGGGSTIGAFGGEAADHGWVTKGAAQQGTFNGKPLSSAAGSRRSRRCLPGTPTTSSGSSARGSPRGATARSPRATSRRTPSTSAPRDACPTAGSRSRTPRLPGDGSRAVLRQVSVDGQPRGLHDAGRRGAMDAVGAALRGGRLGISRGTRSASSARN